MRTVTEIPEKSVLKPFQRKGVQGVCIACEQPIQAHYGHRNAWIGCQAPGLEPNTPFLLVPARRRGELRSMKALIAAHSERLTEGKQAPHSSKPATSKAQAPVVVVMPAAERPAREVVYVADKRVSPKKFGSPRLQEVLRTLQRRKHGMRRKELLSKMNATTHPGIVDGAVRRLVVAKAVRSVSVDATA